MREKVTDSWRENEPANKSHTTFGLKAKPAQAPGFRGHGLAVTAAEGRPPLRWSVRRSKWFATGLVELGIFLVGGAAQKNDAPVVPE